MNKLYCSTGALVGRICNYDYSLIGKHLPNLYDFGLIDGMEFMFIPFYYDVKKEIIDTVKSCEVPCPLIHCEKDVGVLLSESDDYATNKALDLLKINCEVGKAIGASQMVFHLWGGIKSDSKIEYNISKLPEILKITDDYELELLIENIPCTTYSGLENWRKLYEFIPKIGFTFDTRFGAFHDEIGDILEEPIWDSIKHMHISDYSSYPRDFSKIRPILHPGDGVIDFSKIFCGLKDNSYNGSLTLESPVMIPQGADIKKLTSSLLYIKNQIK